MMSRGTILPSYQLPCPSHLRKAYIPYPRSEVTLDAIRISDTDLNVILFPDTRTRIDLFALDKHAPNRIEAGLSNLTFSYSIRSKQFPKSITAPSTAGLRMRSGCRFCFSIANDKARSGLWSQKYIPEPSQSYRFSLLTKASAPFSASCATDSSHP